MSLYSFNSLALMDGNSWIKRCDAGGGPLALLCDSSRSCETKLSRNCSWSWSPCCSWSRNWLNKLKSRAHENMQNPNSASYVAVCSSWSMRGMAMEDVAGVPVAWGDMKSPKSTSYRFFCCVCLIFSSSRLKWVAHERTRPYQSSSPCYRRLSLDFFF